MIADSKRPRWGDCACCGLWNTCGKKPDALDLQKMGHKLNFFENGIRIESWG